MQLKLSAVSSLSSLPLYHCPEAFSLLDRSQYKIQLVLQLGDLQHGLQTYSIRPQTTMHTHSGTDPVDTNAAL